MDLEKIRENRARKVLEFSLPAILAMVLTSMITVADGFFMGNYVGKEGIAAVNLGLPIVYLYLGVGLMVSIGGVAMAGMALGSADKKACNRIFNQTIATTLGGRCFDQLRHGFLLGSCDFYPSWRRKGCRVFPGILPDYAAGASGDGGKFFLWNVYPGGGESSVLYEGQHISGAV